MASLYERLARRASEKGTFTIDPEARSWQEPELLEEPKAMRNQLRAEMERIARVEGVTMETTMKTGVWKLAKFVKFREEKFGGVLFETRQEKVYTLNPTAAAVVREIAAGSSDVCAAVKAKFQDTTGQIEAEVNAFIADLKTKGLIVE